MGSHPPPPRSAPPGRSTSARRRCRSPPGWSLAPACRWASAPAPGTNRCRRPEQIPSPAAWRDRRCRRRAGRGRSPHPRSSTTPRPACRETPIATRELTFLPRLVVFRGMPDPRWWNFEDAVTDLGQLAADTVDLAKLLVMEFALVYGNDWFLVPVPTPIGTLARVTSLVVTDTFGVRTSIGPAEPTAVAAGDSPWCMFKLSGAGSRSDFIMMAPTLGLAADAEPLEEVLFLRDDTAAMAWAIEQRLQGDLDAPIDAYAMSLQRQAGAPAPPLKRHGIGVDG